MPSRWLRLAAVFLLSLPVPRLHSQGALRLAAIQEGGHEGVGILRPRAAGECFVVIPKHVVDPDSTSTFSAVPDAGTRVELDNVLDRYSADLGLWRINRRMDRTACAAWPSASEVNRVLERAERHGTQGVVTPQTPQGRGEQIRVGIRGLTGTSFRVYSADGQALRRGMSGSPVHVSGTLVGILTEIDQSDEGEEPYGVALRLDYVEDHLGRFFYPGRPPNDLLIFASVAVPGLGQARTRRTEAALLWAAVAAGPTIYAVFAEKEEQVPRTRMLPDGREEIYYESRTVNPYRKFSWIPWVAVGIGSVLEARSHAGRRYIPPERTDPSLRRRASLHVEPRVLPSTGRATQMQIAEIRF